MGELSSVRANAERDPNYRPYCLRCRGLVRMTKVATMHWKCVCGAEHKEEEEGYAKIPPEHPAYDRVQALLARGAFACDSVDHNEPYETGCSNPACFKFVKGGAPCNGPVTPAATGGGLT